MKIKFYCAFVCIIALSACKKQPSVCIDGPLVVAEGETPTYTWCGENSDDIEWRFGGERIHGKTFTPVFKQRGNLSLEVNAKNGNKQSTKGFFIEYGKKSKLFCKVFNECTAGNVSLPSQSGNCKAYLYESKTAWIEDVYNGVHTLAKDSVSCEYSSAYSAALASFKKSYPEGSGRIFSIEYRDPNNGTSYISNWKDIFYGSSTFEMANFDYSDITIETRLTSYTKLFFSGTWKLTASYVNGNNVPLQPCNEDDFLKFKADGTWTYNTGSDNCNGTSLPSNGTFNNFPQCDSPLVFNLTTSSGPFASSYCEFTINTIKVNFSSGSLSGYFTFTHHP